MIVEQENVITEAEAEVEEEALMIIDEDEREELNKKCEDFIKKMKVTFCYEPYADTSNYSNNHRNKNSLVLVK